MSNVEKYLSIFERIITLFKTKFHNSITNIIVIFGISLATESQINIFEALAVAFYELIIGPSDYLRELLSGNPNPWLGVVFVVIGLIYNAIVTVGLELIRRYKDAIPKQPELKFTMLNSDMEEFDENYTLRGKLCFHSIVNIPDNTLYSDIASEEMEKSRVNIGGINYDSNQYRVNQEFYRERAKFLQVWGGAELIILAISNNGEVLAKNVKVELCIEKTKGLSASPEISCYLKTPKQEEDSYQLQTPNHHKPDDEITRHNTNSQYIFEWLAGDLQAKKEIHKSSMCIFLRTEIDIKIKVKIYCDELSSPIVSEYKISPSPDKIDFNLSLLKSSGRDFHREVDNMIMNGYLTRYSQQTIQDYENSRNELVPK